MEPSPKAMYQSGWTPAVTCDGLYGPYSHTGLICTRSAEGGHHAERHHVDEAAVERRRSGRTGGRRRSSVRPGRPLGVLLLDRPAGGDVIRARMEPRDQQHVHDVEPADDHRAGELAAEDQRSAATCRRPGTTGSHRRHPKARAGEQIVGQRVAHEAFAHPMSNRKQPISQLVSRGLRNSPVKKMRSRWTTIAAINSSAAQWWICRMMRPPRTSKEI